MYLYSACVHVVQCTCTCLNENVQFVLFMDLTCFMLYAYHHNTFILLSLSQARALWRLCGRLATLVALLALTTLSNHPPSEAF